jgi:hypothetical protein
MYTSEINMTGLALIILNLGVCILLRVFIHWKLTSSMATVEMKLFLVKAGL